MLSFIKRRQFLQFTGSMLATLGLSQLEIEQQAIRYAQVLAQDTPRKRALLVGINDYLNLGQFQWYPLAGAVNDTQIQKELLINLFGFQANEIRILHNQEATRDNVLQAFEDHLIKWVQPGDVVIFHFSGHGSQVADPDKVFDDGRVSTIVPSSEDVAPVPAKQEILIPDRERGEMYKFKIGKDPGMAEVLVIASTTPLTKAIQLLRTLAAEKPEHRGIPVNLDKEPADAIASLLDDLDKGSRGGGTSAFTEEVGNAIADVRQIDTRQMAALSITFEVIYSNFQVNRPHLWGGRPRPPSPEQTGEDARTTRT